MTINVRPCPTIYLTYHTYGLFLPLQWGTGWGEAGFARIAFSGDGPGVCGMQQYAYTSGLAFSSNFGSGSAVAVAAVSA
jgi:hypothetical protein